MLGAARLVRVAGNLDGTVVGRWLPANQPMRIKGAGPATAISHTFGDAAAVSIHKPAKIQHFSERNRTEVQIKSRDKNIVIGIKQVLREQEESIDELTFVDGDALDFLPNLLFQV